MESLQQNKPDKLNIILFFFLFVFLSFIFFTHTLLSFIDRLKGEKAIGIYGYALWGVFFLFIFVLLVKIIFKYTKKNGIIDNLSVILFALGNVYFAHSLLSFLEKNFLKIDTTHVSLILSLVFGVVAFCIKNEFFTSRLILKSEDTALAAKDEELEQARAELAALREENAALKAELEKARQEKGQDAPKWYGLIAVVEQCRSEGKTPQETAVELKARGASYAIIGGLLHPEGDISDWTQYGSNIVEGNTKKLAW